MQAYFLAERSCGFRINGIHLGIVDGFERKIQLQPSDKVFCELLPTGGFLPVRFCFDEDFLLCPPPPIRLYYTENAVAVYACQFLRADQTMKVLWQKRLGNTLLTLVLQGKLQLSLQNGTGFYLLDLPDSLESCEASELEDRILLKTENAFAVVSQNGELLLHSEGKVLESADFLKAEIPFHDCMGHTALCEWRHGKLTNCTIRSLREPTEATFALALLESALIGADCAPFLSPALEKKANSLKEYLGDYRSVVLTSERNKIGLVYERKPRIFDVRYFLIETADGKISNLKPVP